MNKQKLALKWLNKEFGNLTPIVKDGRTYYVDKDRLPLFFYYQDQESLLNLLASLEQQSLKPGQVFIADNNSIQSIVLKNYSFPVQITKLEENKGFAAGANVALKNAINKDFSQFILIVVTVIQPLAICFRNIKTSVSRIS